MSILARKMSTVSSVPGSYAAFVEQFKPVQTRFLETIVPFCSSPLKEDKAEISAGRYGVLLGQLEDGAPSFVLNSADHKNLGFVQISSDLAKMISRQKLGAKGDTGKDNSPIALLDLVLLQPVINDAAKALQDILGEGSESLKANERHLSIADVSGIDEADKWVCLTLSYVFKEVMDKAPVADAPKAEDDKEGGEQDASADKSAEDAPLCFELSFMFSALLADTLVLSLQSGGDGISLDPANPWSSHMHATVMQSSMPLKVIVEVLNMSVADCTRLELGQTIRLPGASHRSLSVSTETSAGLVDLARSTLGVAKSNKAVKLLDDIDPNFISDIETVLQA